MKKIDSRLRCRPPTPNFCLSCEMLLPSSRDTSYLARIVRMLCSTHATNHVVCTRSFQAVLLIVRVLCAAHETRASVMDGRLRCEFPCWRHDQGESMKKFAQGHRQVRPFSRFALNENACGRKRGLVSLICALSDTSIRDSRQHCCHVPPQDLYSQSPLCDGMS